MGIRARRRPSADVTAAAWALLNDEPPPADSNPWELWFHEFEPEVGPPTKCYLSLRESWARSREEILGRWLRDRPGTRPSSWWRWDAPEPRPEGESEADYLERHGLLTDAERRALRAAA